MTSKEAVTDFSPEAVEAILSAFNDCALQAIQDEDRIFSAAPRRSQSMTVKRSDCTSHVWYGYLNPRGGMALPATGSLLIEMSLSKPTPPTPHP